jgi:hypothetical protein
MGLVKSHETWIWCALSGAKECTGMVCHCWPTQKQGDGVQSLLTLGHSKLCKVMIDLAQKRTHGASLKALTEMTSSLLPFLEKHTRL